MTSAAARTRSCCGGSGAGSRAGFDPRDTVAAIPGHGSTKINAAYAFGGPPLAIRTIEQFTGVKINHIIIVNLAAFPQFIDAIGGIDIQTGRICSDISGGTKNGGFSLHLQPGTHHLNGIQALTLARTRHNACNPAENDLTRVLDLDDPSSLACLPLPSPASLSSRERFRVP